MHFGVFDYRQVMQTNVKCGHFFENGCMEISVNSGLPSPPPPPGEFLEKALIEGERGRQRERGGSLMLALTRTDVDFEWKQE